MQNTPIKNELLGLERKFWQAMKDRDFDAALSLTDYPCIVAGAYGIDLVDRQKFISMMESSPYKITDFQLKDMDSHAKDKPTPSEDV